MTVDVEANKNSEIVRFFVVRHGQTNHNVQKIMQGHLDVDLNDTGREQADKVGRSLSMITFDTVHSSDLVRCVNTTDTILKYQETDLELRTTSSLRERYMGVVQGMNIKDALRQYGDDFRNMGEKEHELIKRIDDEFEGIVKESMGKGDKNVLVCTHGGVLTTYFNYLYGRKGYKLGGSLTEERLKVPFNTSISIIDIDRETGDGVIRDFGNTRHLGGDLEVKDQNLR